MGDLQEIYSRSREYPRYNVSDTEGLDIYNIFRKAWNPDNISGVPEVPFVRRILKNVYAPNWARINHSRNDVRIRFHCTKRKCAIGDSRSSSNPGLGCKNSFCKNQSGSDVCRACAILNGGFKISKAGSHVKLGKGVYTSCSAMKADRYATTDNKYRFMLVCGVNMGKTRDFTTKISVSDAQLFENNGYNSLQGVPTGKMKYDPVYAFENIRDHDNFSHGETVSFNAADVSPRYLIIYENADYHKRSLTRSSTSNYSTSHHKSSSSISRRPDLSSRSKTYSNYPYQ